VQIDADGKQNNSTLRIAAPLQGSKHMEGETVQMAGRVKIQCAGKVNRANTLDLVDLQSG